MKIPIVILAVLGLACGKSLPTRSLQDDLDDFVALLPTDQILAISLDYLSNDREVQELVIYIQSTEFVSNLKTVEDAQEFKDVAKFLSDLGIDVYAAINLINDILGLPQIQPKHSTRRRVGVNGLIDDVVDVLPTANLKALFENKLETSKEFRAAVEAICSPEFKKILEQLRALQIYQDLLQGLRDKGVEADRIIALVKAIFSLPCQ